MKQLCKVFLWDVFAGLRVIGVAGLVLGLVVLVLLLVVWAAAKFAWFIVPLLILGVIWFAGAVERWSY